MSAIAVAVIVGDCLVLCPPVQLPEGAYFLLARSLNRRDTSSTNRASRHGDLGLTKFMIEVNHIRMET